MCLVCYYILSRARPDPAIIAECASVDLIDMFDRARQSGRLMWGS